MRCIFFEKKYCLLSDFACNASPGQMLIVFALHVNCGKVLYMLSIKGMHCFL